MTLQDTISQSLTVQQGATWREVLTWTDSAGEAIDLSTGFTASLVARVNVDDVAAVIDLDESSGLTLGDGTITIEQTATETTAFDFDKASYNLEITETVSSDVQRAYQGNIVLSKDVNY